jgi:hypothetical protein
LNSRRLFTVVLFFRRGTASEQTSPYTAILILKVSVTAVSEELA